MTTIKDHVQAGAALLDKVLPDWWNGKETPTIDLETLQMGSLSACVLGQCFGSYEAGCDKLGITAWSGAKPAESKAFGFFELNDPWHTEIKRRRRNAKQS